MNDKKEKQIVITRVNGVLYAMSGETGVGWDKSLLPKSCSLKKLDFPFE
jgi:hypothetical protein